VRWEAFLIRLCILHRCFLFGRSRDRRDLVKFSEALAAFLWFSLGFMGAFGTGWR